MGFQDAGSRSPVAPGAVRFQQARSETTILRMGITGRDGIANRSLSRGVIYGGAHVPNTRSSKSGSLRSLGEVDGDLEPAKR